MTALWPLVPQQLQSDPDIVAAYNHCLRLEASLQNANARTAVKDLVYVRIMGYLIHFVPNDSGKQKVASEINECYDDDIKLLAIGQSYYDHYIRAFRANKGGTPIPSTHSSPSHPSFHTLVDMVNDSLIPATPSHTVAKKKALARDGYRCVISGDYDSKSLRLIPELREQMSANAARATLTQCTHIFSESTNLDIEQETSKRNYAATMWAIMKQFGYKTLPEELNGYKVHRLENVMTMGVHFHNLFDELKLWLSATDNQNEYKVESSEPYQVSGCPEIITFVTPDPAQLPLPSPTYLAIHATCAKVAHLSGAGEYIDEFERDMEDGSTLDPSGASAWILEEAIRGLQIAGLADY